MSQSNIADKNALWVALNFIFPKTQESGETYVSKSVKFKVFVDEECVGEVGKQDKQYFISNMKIGCKVDILKGDLEKGEVFSSLSWIVGEQQATLYLNESTSKKVNMNFANQNRVEIVDERDWDFINENGELNYGNDTAEENQTEEN